MGVMTGISQLFSDLGSCMSFFAGMFGLLPLAVKLLIYFAFGGVVLLGLMQMFLRSV